MKEEDLEYNISKNFKLEEGHFLMTAHDDESLKLKVFRTLSEVREYVEEQFEKEITDKEFKDYFNESYVDGDSYEAKALFRYEKGELKCVFGHVDIS